MATFTGVCPHCGQIEPWQFGTVSISFPPTGGDYEWAELETPLRCPACQERFEVRVRADTDDGQVSDLIYSPLPTLENWHCYVVGELLRHSSNLVSVKIMGLAKTLPIAKKILADQGGPVEGGYRTVRVLKLTSAGYSHLDGKPLHKSANRHLSYR